MLDSVSAQRSTGQSSPGPLGYALAVAVGFLALVVELGIAAHLQTDSSWGFVDTALLVLFAGAVPAALIGAVGATFVHLATRRAQSQWPSVVLAGLLGLLVGLLFWQGGPLLAGMLALDAAGGRLAVVPLAHRRSQASD